MTKVVAEDVPVLGPLSVPVGNTAIFTAQLRAIESKRSDALFIDHYAETLAGKEGEEAWKLMEKSFKGGIFMSSGQTRRFLRNRLAVRHRYFDDFLLDKSNLHNTPQVVLLAAGLDTRAFRLNWPKNTVVYEMDTEEVLKFKNDRLESLNAQPKCKRVCIPSDLAVDNWEELLIQNGYIRDRPALFLAEGLLMYLSSQDAHAFVSRLASFAANGSWFAGDQTSGTKSIFAARNVHSMMARAGAPFLFSVKNPEKFLKTCGWRKTIVRQGGEVAKKYHRGSLPSVPRWLPSPFPRQWLMTATK